MKQTGKRIGFCLLLTLLTALTLWAASAETEGIFTYTVTGDAATITEVDYADAAEIMIPETLGGYTVKALGDRCFYDDTLSIGDGADSVLIPKTVETIAPGAFTYADIKRILVNEENPFFASDSFGVLFNKDMTQLLHTGCAFDAGIYHVPNTVRSIASSAFHSCVFMEEYDIPSSVESIGSQAFWENQNLKQIHFSEGLQSIADNCFVWCNQLTSVTIPSTVTSISYGAFTELDGLKEVIFSEGIQVLPRLVFESDISLERVYLPQSLTSIGQGAFGNCTALTDICYAGSAEDWAAISINTSSYAGSRPVVIDTCNIHYNVPIEAYKDLAFETDNDILGKLTSEIEEALR